MNIRVKNWEENIHAIEMKREDGEWWSKRENEKLERMRWIEEEDYLERWCCLKKNRKHGVVWRRRLSGAMVLSTAEKEREKSEEREVDQEVWIAVSEKEREEDEEVGRKEKDWVSGIQRWDEKIEILFSFWFIFWSSKIMRVWHVNLFIFYSKKYFNCNNLEIIFY